MIVDKNLSFDKSLTGDFTLINNDETKNLVGKFQENNFIFTGCQIINIRLFDNIYSAPVRNFSISKVWKNLMDSDGLFGFESKNKFYHVTDLEIYNKLLKGY